MRSIAIRSPANRARWVGRINHRSRLPTGRRRSSHRTRPAIRGPPDVGVKVAGARKSCEALISRRRRSASIFAAGETGCRIKGRAVWAGSSKRREKIASAHLMSNRLPRNGLTLLHWCHGAVAVPAPAPMNERYLQSRSLHCRALRAPRARKNRIDVANCRRWSARTFGHRNCHGSTQYASGAAT